MKKVLILACAALTACTNDIDLGPNKEQVETLSNAIGFQMAKKNMTTTKAPALQSKGHYNFGVWGYKKLTATSGSAIMENYLVGYMDEANHKGYYMTDDNQTTLGDKDGVANGKSQWAYEKLGSSDYTYDGSDGYYKNTDMKYMSNSANQFLRYWDKSTESTKFFAYAPYLNADEADRVKFEYNTDQMMTLPLSERKVEKGEDESLAEYMVATQEVTKANYNNDVQLHFRRLNAKVNIKFYETIEGYNVKIVDLQSGTIPGVTAVPAVAPVAGSTSYTHGNQYKSTKVKVKFNGITTTTGASEPNIDYQATTSATKYASSDYMTFTAPSGTGVCSAEGYISGKDVIIGTTTITDSNAKENASKSPSTYFVIPKQTGDNSGLTFHVTYELTALQTDEKITVHNATVHVPEANCKWEAGKAYTYIFRITKNSNGSTDPSKPINPAEPTPDTDKALYPIVFDGCTVIDWDNVTPTEHEITNGTFNYYLTLSASTLSKAAGATPITVNAYKKDGTTDTSVTDGELKIFDSSNTEKTTDFTITTSTSAAPTIAAKPTANSGETYTLKYTISGTKVLEAKFTVTE